MSTWTVFASTFAVLGMCIGAYVCGYAKGRMDERNQQERNDIRKRMSMPPLPPYRTVLTRMP